MTAKRNSVADAMHDCIRNAGGREFHRLNLLN